MSKTWARANWLIYALGGGWGHLNRALALARVAGAQADIHILTNSLYQQHIGPIAPPLYLHGIDPALSLNATRDRVRQLIQQSTWECVIIDTFPRGLGGELVDIMPQLTSCKVLVHRDLRPAYIHQMEVAAFVAAHYDRILVPGELGAALLTHLPQAIRTPPWLIRSADELPPPAIARQYLKLADSDTTPVVVVLAGGRPEEQHWYGQITQALAQEFPELTVRCIAAERPPQCPEALWISHYPAMECLVAAQGVVGSGGYNTVNECRVLSVPLIACPFPRLYDRQTFRLTYAKLQGAEIALVKTVAEVLTRVNQWLTTHRLELPARRPSFLNGVKQAIQAIHRTLEQQSPTRLG